MTVRYTLRVIFCRLSGKFNLRSLNNLEDGDKTIRKSMIILRIRAVYMGAGLS